MSEQRNTGYDVVIVGSGMGSVCAALVAKDHGLRPLIIEKLDGFGGTSAWSGGGVWIPNNHLMQQAGRADSFARSMEHLDAAIWHKGPAVTRERREAFVKNGREAIEYLERKGMKMKLAKWWPDYHSDLPGGEQASRTLVAELFDVNQLGEWKQRLLEPKMPPFRFTMDELSTLLLVKRTWAAKCFAVRFGLRLLTQKLTGRDLRGGGIAWQGRLLQIALRENIDIQLGTPVEKLVVENDRVVGVEARQNGRMVRIDATHGVLLIAGGFARNEAMRERYGRKPVYSHNTNAAPGDTGEIMQAAIALGAAVDCMDEAIWGVTSLGPGNTFPPEALSADGTPTPFGHHFDISLPHAIFVDQNGQRFCNEAGSYMEVGQRLYQRHADTGKGIPAWAIIESRHRKRYMWGNLMGKTPQHWLDSGYMKRADSLEDLARQCDIDADGLKASVSRFNEFCHKGVDEDFQRGGKAFDLSHGDPTVKPNPSLGAIEKPPFYAVAIYPGDVGTYGGLVTDAQARVLRENGTPIPGLYATGATTASVLGRTYAGAGASLGPALAFAYAAAQHIAKESGLKP